MTNQEAFDSALFGIRGQNYQRSYTTASDGLIHCRYRGPDELKCAAGHCIPDELMMFVKEGNSITSLIDDSVALQRHFEGVNRDMLRQLQYVHDNTSSTNEQWERNMHQIAQEFNLVYTPA